MSEEEVEFEGNCFICGKKTVEEDRDIDECVCPECRPKVGLIKQKAMEKTLKLLRSE